MPSGQGQVGRTRATGEDDQPAVEPIVQWPAGHRRRGRRRRRPLLRPTTSKRRYEALGPGPCPERSSLLLIRHRDRSAPWRAVRSCASITCGCGAQCPADAPLHPSDRRRRWPLPATRTRLGVVRRRAGRVLVDAPVDPRSAPSPGGRDPRGCGRTLGEDLGKELLAAEPGMHAHEQDQGLSWSSQGPSASNGVSGFTANPTSKAELAVDPAEEGRGAAHLRRGPSTPSAPAWRNASR